MLGEQRWDPARDPEHRGVDGGHRAGTHSAGIRRPKSKDHQGAQVVESRVVGGVAARFRATSHWTIRSARRSPLARVVEQVTQDRRGGAEGERAHGPEGPARHPVVASASQHTTRTRSARLSRGGFTSERAPPSAGPAPARRRRRRGGRARTCRRPGRRRSRRRGRRRSKAASATSWRRRGQAGGSSDRDGAVARPAVSACRRPRTRTITAIPIADHCAPSARTRRHGQGPGGRAGRPLAPFPAVGAFDLAFDVGPHQRIGVLGPVVSAAWARVMITKATVHRTAMVLSLARNPASCWSSSGVRPDHLARCG